jgi:serine/threonine protein kinase
MAGMEGMRLGAYELTERIGGGGMAEVYRAKQLTAFGREVAIKIIRPGFSEDPSFRERFLREAQAISKLSHPNILPLIEFGEENGTLYLVMPLAREGTLRDLLKQRNSPLSLEEAIPLFIQLCDAVQYAHEEGIIHRDIKPQNVLLQRRTHVLLADFGIARDTAENQHMTTTGAGIGTVEYMAPEQAIGQANPRSDIYSLGIVLYQMLTGNVPYSGSTPFQVLMKHTNDALPDPRLLNPSLPSEIVHVLQVALAKDPQRRFQSAQALGRAVQQVRPDAVPDVLPPLGTNQPPISIMPPKPTITKQTTWHGQDFRDVPIEPGSPEFPSGPAPVGPGGFVGAPRDRQGPPLPPEQWANAAPGAADYDQPTWSTQGGRAAMPQGPGWQQPGPMGPPPYGGGGQFPQRPVPQRGRGPLIVALIAALILILVISSVGVAYVLGVFGTSTGSQTAQRATATTAVQPTPTPTATDTPTPTPSPTPTPTPTPRPEPTHTPTPPAIPPPPALHSPANGASFSNYPRTTTLTWHSVYGAHSYVVQIYYAAGNSCSDSLTAYPPYTVTGTSYTFNFIGAQAGCWKVASVGSGGQGSFSPLWQFVYTV